MSTSVDYEVSEEDQRKIVQFSLLHHKKSKIDQKLKLLQHQKNLLKDAQEEMLVSIDTPLYNIGECFMSLGEGELEEELRLRDSEVDAEIGKLTDELERNVAESKSLKSELYNKFGNRINLEC